jgi:glycine dehydrogenase subunit 1
MSLLGKTGLRRLAEVNVARAHDAFGRLIHQAGIQAGFAGPFFNEFVLRSGDMDGLLGRCASEKIVPGVALRQWYPELKDCLLVCVTEMNEREEIERLVRSIAG